MPNVTSDQLRDISVKVVEGFLNEKIPLSVGLAKQAAAVELNSDQIQRAVEATNTIAYLKVLGMSDDRTVEFPLCKFAEVMRLVTLPEEGIAKQAGWEEEKVTTNDRPAASASVNPATGQVLVDADDLNGGDPTNDPYPYDIQDDEALQRGEQEKVAYFIKEAAINERILGELEDRSLVVSEQLVKAAKLVAKDEKGLDKLASIIDGEDYAKLSVLVTGEVKPHRDFGGHQLFKEAELKEVKSLAELFKEAKYIVAEQARRSGLQKRAEALQGEMTKQAGLASGFGYAAGRAAGAPIAMAGKAVAAPFKQVGRAVGNAAGSAMSKVTGKPFTPTPMGRGMKIGLGAAGLAASVGVDAALYNPGKDAETGRSNDVWDALQRG